MNEMSKGTKFLLNLGFKLGIASTVWGAFLIHPAVGFIWLGICILGTVGLIAIAKGIEEGKKAKEEKVK